MNNIIHFIKYHNAFTIGLALVFVFGGAVFASDDIRDNVIGEKIVTEQGIDNSQILSADLDNFDFQLTIQNVQEDSQNYYIDYAYQTLVINNSNIWQPALLGKTLSVPKAVLATSSDLGFYAQGELGEVVDHELAYLKKVQELEKEKGRTQIVETTAYTGLIGLVLDTKTKILPGYEPPVAQPAPDITGGSTSQISGNKEVEPQNILTPTIQNGANRPCGSDVGDCRIGVQIYQDGAWGECLGAVFPTAEICDEVDNDCDGTVDEGGVCSAIEPEPEPEPITTSTEPIVEPIATSTDGMATTTP